MKSLAKYRKTAAAVAGALIAWWGVVIDSAPQAITAGEYRSGAILVLTAVGVFALPNEPKP